MLSIERIDLFNFRSYVGNHTFYLPTQNGLFNLIGKNLAEPTLGSNGSGKSTLLDAIFWVLYGRTTRGLKATDVVSWGKEGCAVTVALTIAQTRLLVSRTQNPNALTITENDATSGHRIDQAALEKYLRLTPTAFLYSVILPQFGEAFFDLAPTAKLALFSDIMELDFWLERSQAADHLAAEINDERIKQQVKINTRKAQQKIFEDDIEKLGEKEAVFADKQAVLIKGLESDLKELAKDAKNAEAELNYTRNVLKDLEAKAAKLAGKDVCPTCKQGIPNADLKAIQKNIADFEGKLRRHERENPKAKQGDLKATIDKEAKRENPYSEFIEEKKLGLVALKKQLEVATAALAKLDEEHSAVSFWINGFKRVRLFIVEEAIQQLEIEVNNNLTSLGLLDWHIGFDVERENKSGGITKGFIVLITPPGAGEPVKFESYSGGESQRLRLAGDLGLANLIMERAGLINTVEFFDEPSCHLSQEGLLDLAETLTQRAESQSKRIFLVDHSIIDFSGFEGTICVSKDEDGSHISGP